MKTYEYVIVGAGIAGCSVAHFLKDEQNLLLIDRNEDVAYGASGAAGAFLSPLVGKPNGFKSLVTQALKFSIGFYKEHFPDIIKNEGVVRIPKNQEDAQKFESYKPYMDFEYEARDDGYYFKIGSRINPYEICTNLSKNIQKKFNYEVQHIENIDGIWHINHGEIRTKKLILTTGADISLLKERYVNIRAVWGQKIDVTTTTAVDVNYHKACSLSASTAIEKNKYLVSIGATHRRFDCDTHICNHCLTTANINKIYSSGYTQSVINSDTQELLEKANDIKKLENVNVVDIKVGARSSSVDYFPMVGALIDSSATIEAFPHLKNGTPVQDTRFTYYKDLYILNGVGGRGFVLSPYLAKQLVLKVKNEQNISSDITVNRLFKRWVRKQ